MCAANSHVRFPPESEHVRCTHPCPLWAKSGHRRIVLAIFGAFEAAMPNTRHHHTEPNRLLACFGKQCPVLNDFGWIKELRRKCGQEPISLFLRSDGLFSFCITYGALECSHQNVARENQYRSWIACSAWYFGTA